MSERFLYTHVTDPLARPLLEDLAQEYQSRYAEFYAQEKGPSEMERYPPEAFAPPDGNFLLLVRDGAAVSGGAFMRYDDHTAEFKRIWTRADLRRQGLARKVLAELEAQCSRQGYLRVYLTTGFRQPEAVGLYLGYGYTPLFTLPVQPDGPRKLPFEKRLAAAALDQDTALLGLAPYRPASIGEESFAEEPRP